MAVRGSATGEAGPPAGAGRSTTEFVGGFPGDFRVTIPEARRPGDAWRGDPRAKADREVSLDELRQVGVGGYVSSDVWVPANLGPGTIAQLQVMLKEAGLLSDRFTPGSYDTSTKEAYSALLARANATGSTWEVMLGRMRENPYREAAEEAEARPLPRVSNPADLKTIFRAAAKRALGYGNLPDDELDRMVAAYQGKQIQAHEQSLTPEAGGVVTDPMDPEVFADERAQQIDPTAYQSRKVVEKFNVMADFFGGSGGA